MRPSKPALLAALAAALLLFLAPPAPQDARAQGLQEAWHRLDTWTSQTSPDQPGLFRGPTGTDVGPDGTIYVADARLGAVHVLESDGTPRALWTGGGALGALRDVAVGQDGLYVTEPDADALHKLGPDGAALARFSLPGRPGGVASFQGELYVGTLGTGLVHVLDEQGEILRTWDAETIPLQQPAGIDVDAEGRVYVADFQPDGTGRNIVYRFDGDGVLLGGYVAEIDGVAQPPVDVAVEDRVDPEVYIATELSLLRMRRGLPVGRPLRSPGAKGLAVGPGSGLVTSVQDFRLGFTGLRRVPDRRAAQLDYEAWGGPFAPLGALEAPRRISANGQDRVFLVDTWPRVQSWSPEGTPLAQFGSGGLQDLAAGLSGSVYGIDGQRLAYWQEDGTELWTWAPLSTRPDTGTPYGWLTHVDGGPSGNIVALDTGDQQLYHLDFSGNTLASWPIAPPDGFMSVGDIALAGDRVYLLNRNERRVEARAVADGALLESFAVPGRAQRLDAAPGGDLFVLLEQGWIWRLAPDGSPRALIEVAEERVATDLAVPSDDRLYVSLADDEVAVFGRDPEGTPPEIPGFEDRCRVRPDKTASPAEVALGDSVEIRLRLDGDCPLADAEADVLLLVDTSGSMSGTKMGAARSAVMEFIGQLDYSRHQVGLITFSTDVELVQPLTANPRELIRRVPTLGDDAGTNMLSAVMMADEELSSARARPGARQAVIILSDGRPNGGYAGLHLYADEFRRAGRELYTIGLGADVDAPFLRRISTSASYYYEAPTEYDLVRIYDTIARRVAATALLRSATVEDLVPDNMDYVAGSARPPADWDPVARSLRWTLGRVEPAGLELRFRVRPTEEGLHPTNVRAEADYLDGVGAQDRLVFPVPEVRVSAPEAYYAFLPLLQKEKCPELRVDVAMVIDTSTSMRESEQGEGSKLQAAVQASRVFLGQLKLPEDRAALVAFHGEAHLVQPLTGDPLALATALDALPVGSGTRIDLGLRTASAALRDRADGHLPVVVLLTDGRQTEGREADLRDAADEAAAAGIIVYTIGLGPDVDRALLETVAGDPRRFYYAPSEEDLADIYRAIAGSIPCG